MRVFQEEVHLHQVGGRPLTCEGLGGERPGRTSSFFVRELGRPPAPALGHRCSGSQAFRPLLPLHHWPLGLGPSGPAWNWTSGVRRPPAGSQQSLGLLGLHRCQQSLRANVCLEASICHIGSAAWRTRSHAGPGSEVPPMPTQEDIWADYRALDTAAPGTGFLSDARSHSKSRTSNANRTKIKVSSMHPAVSPWESGVLSAVSVSGGAAGSCPKIAAPCWACRPLRRDPLTKSGSS